MIFPKGLFTLTIFPVKAKMIASGGKGRGEAGEGTRCLSSPKALQWC